VTRARRRMTLVSSFTSADMDPNRSKAEGVKLLRAYLQYAESGGTHLGDVALEKPALNPFERDVRDRLAAVGIPLTAQYGVSGYFIDFAAAHPTRPGQMVLAIEADGATYHSSPTARDRDRLRQEQLERLGWAFHRIWSTDWFTNPGQEIERAVAAYRRAVAVVDAAPTAPAPLGVPVVVADAAAPARGTPPPLQPGLAITEYSRRRLVELVRWIESDTLLRTEDQLLTEVVNFLGYKRRGSRIVSVVTDAIRQARQ
jgi:very-short-patch-repair endonuclease